LKILKYTFILPFVLVYTNIKGQYLKGGDINVSKAPGNTYTINARVVIHWPVTINKPFLKINWGDGSLLDSIPYSGSNCTLYNSTTLKYSGTHTFSPNSSFTISVIDSFLVSDFSNIPNSSTQKLYLRSELNTSTSFQPNSTPEIGVVCLSDSVPCGNIPAYNPGLTDSEGDSLGYSIVSPPLISGYVMPSASVDMYGNVKISNTYPALLSVSLRIDEWRKISNVYTKIASTFQELSFKTYSYVVGIEENNVVTNDLEIFPNPSKGLINFEWGSNGFKRAEILIYNSIGQLVYKDLVNEGNDLTPQNLNVANLSNGVYIAIIKTEDQLLTAKFIKE
jgi:hypothetical protein